MKKGLLFAVALACVALFQGSPATSAEITRTGPPRVMASDDVQWVGVAVSRTGGRVFQSDPKGYENDGRSAAISECERATGVSCANAISVPSDWDVTVLRCGSEYFVAGSGQGVADDNAQKKASSAGYYSGCVKVASY